MSSAMTTISKMRLIWSSIQGLAAVQSFAKLKLVWRMYVWAWNAGKRSSKDRQKIVKNTSYDWISHEEFCFNTSLQNRILCWTLGIPALSDAVVASLTWALSGNGHTISMIDDMSDIYRTKLALVSPTGDPSLPDKSGQLGARDCILFGIHIELHWLFGLRGSVCVTSAALSPPPQRSRRESGAIKCPVLVLRFGPQCFAGRPGDDDKHW